MKSIKECQLCKAEGKTFIGARGRNSLQTHLSKVHSLSLDEYHLQVASPEAKDVVGKCKVCGGKVTWSRRYEQFNQTCSNTCKLKLIHSKKASRTVSKDDSQTEKAVLS